VGAPGAATPDTALRARRWSIWPTSIAETCPRRLTNRVADWRSWPELLLRSALPLVVVGRGVPGCRQEPEANQNQWGDAGTAAVEALIRLLLEAISARYWNRSPPSAACISLRSLADTTQIGAASCILRTTCAAQFTRGASVRYCTHRELLMALPYNPYQPRIL